MKMRTAKKSKAKKKSKVKRCLGQIEGRAKRGLTDSDKPPRSASSPSGVGAGSLNNLTKHSILSTTKNFLPENKR